MEQMLNQADRLWHGATPIEQVNLMNSQGVNPLLSACIKIETRGAPGQKRSQVFGSLIGRCPMLLAGVPERAEILRNFFTTNRGAVMETKNTDNHEVATQQIRALIESLDRDGILPVPVGDAKHDFRTVSITSTEGAALRRWVNSENASHTIEIGLAFGFSALHICEGLLLNKTQEPKHVALDPWQSSAYANRGLELLEEAGVTLLVEFHAEKSQLVLPQFVKAGRQFDLAFVDGNHRFDAVFVDLYYLGLLVRKRGIIFIDDYSLPGVGRAASFYVNNLGWKIEETSPPDDGHGWVVLRTSEHEDTRDFRYFVDF